MTDTPLPTSTVSSALVAGNAPAGDWRIDPACALARACPAIPASALEIVEETGSTNTDLMLLMRNLPREEAAAGVHAVRVAYRQTAGRGRQGRNWYAEPGRALMFSLACVLPRPLAGLTGLSLAVGVALVEALRALPGLTAGDAARIGLKWPNDILLDEGKLAGILIETAWSTPAASAAVVGIGLNLREDEALASALASAQASAQPFVQASDLAAAGARTQAHAQAKAPFVMRATPPASLSRVWPEASVTESLAAALEALTSMIERFSADGFAPFRSRWNACHVHAGREVVLFEQGVELTRGTALDVDETGRLLISTAQGVMPIATGDVSLRATHSTPAPLVR
ncbi:MAG: BirA family transcriptional regulator [Paraburkholderia sp.]|nr:BirA family transcriptional regulator [Paraburkholderia sp.]